MHSLRGIGYWRSDRQPDLPDPSAFIDPTWDEDTREEICDYLRRGLLGRACMGYSPRRVCWKKDNGNLEFTDLTYVWPSGLVHYVQEYFLRLPDEFVLHALEVQQANETADIDLDW